MGFSEAWDKASDYAESKIAGSLSDALAVFVGGLQTTDNDMGPEPVEAAVKEEPHLRREEGRPLAKDGSTNTNILSGITNQNLLFLAGVGLVAYLVLK